MHNIQRERHIAKTITWRAIGTIDTMVLAFIVSGDPIIGVKIGGVEVISKMFLYYCHERMWLKSKFGIKEMPKN